MKLRILNPDFKERIMKMLEKQYFMKHIDLDLTDITPGSVSARLKIGQAHQQQNGLLHGGVISTAADVVMGFSAVTLVAADQLVLTGEMKVSYLNPGLGETLEATGVVLKPGRRVNFCEAELFVVRGETRVLVAKASSSMITINKADLDR